MGKDSKQRNVQLKEINSKIHCFSPNKIESLLKFVNQLSKLKDGVVMPESLSITKAEDVESKKFVVSFEWIDTKKCDFSGVTEAKATAIIEKLNNINLTTFREFNNLVKKSPISKGSGDKDYDALFNGLPEDVEKIYEIPFTDDGRIFFFMDAVANVYLVAIKTKHINLHHE